MVEVTAFGLSVIVSGTIFTGLMLWLWTKKDITLQKKGQITLLLITGLLSVVYASFAFALISLDNASYYSQGRNLGDINYNQVLANARQADYVVDGPGYASSELYEAGGIWSPNVSQVRSYLGDSFWVRSVNYYFPEDKLLELGFLNGTTTFSYYNESLQSTFFTNTEADTLPDDDIVIAHLKLIFEFSDAEAQLYMVRLKQNAENENDASVTVPLQPDFSSLYSSLKNSSDRFSFTETTGTGSTRQIFYENGSTVGSINYVVQSSRVIHRENGSDYVVQIDPKGGVNLQIRLSTGKEIPEEDYRRVFREMFSKLRLDPAEVDNFKFQYSPSSWE